MPTSARRIAFWTLGIFIAVFVLTWGANYVLVGHPISSALQEDSRNSGYRLRGHYGSYVIPSSLVLDLREVGEVAPADLMRGLFQSAKAMHDAGRKFNQVTLARGGTPVFLMAGSDFEEIGESFAGGENVIYLIRTLPEKLLLPDGTSAFGRWEGGILGVLAHQMGDANRMSAAWAAGTPLQRREVSD